MSLSTMANYQINGYRSLNIQLSRTTRNVLRVGGVPGRGESNEIIQFEQGECITCSIF